VFMITGAGAEGLSLRNVRTVHIMEPYWNTVRTEQVKGRAVRICSHSDLPYNPDPALNQRTVEIFTYISKISDAMKKARTIDQTLITIDDGKTTDEHIYEISRAKEQVSHDFLQAMKEGSVDCLLNQSENERISCFMYDGPIEEFIYDPRINYDKDMTDIHSKQIVATAQPAMQGTTVPAPTTPAPSAPQQEGTKYPLIAYQKKFYVKVPKGDYFGLYAATDMLLTKEVGKIVTVDGKQKVQLYGP